jgi:alpha-tubulin suppressor-like RCC1 family protein
VPVSLSGEVSRVSARDHCLAVVGGSVWAWGFNNKGQLGDGTTENRNLPVRVQGFAGEGFLTDIMAVAAGDGHSIAVRRDGLVWAWGANDQGQLGIGSNRDQRFPMLVRGTDNLGPLLQGIVEVTAGYDHSVALTSDGRVVSWGGNGTGQLGIGSRRASTWPVQIRNTDGTPLTGVCGIAAGRGHSLALMCDGSVRVWGSDNNGQLGIGMAVLDRLEPWQMLQSPGTPITDVRQVAAGSQRSFVVLNNGRVLGCGMNNGGDLGDGTVENQPFPVLILADGGGPLTGATSIAAGYDHALVRMQDSTLRSWGQNREGQLGDGGNTDRRSAVIVRASVGRPDAFIVDAGAPFRDVVFRLISCGNGFSVAIKESAGLSLGNLLLGVATATLALGFILYYRKRRG